MNAEIITIGDEILIGQIVDTNSAWIAKELNKIGISINRINSISDSSQEIVTSLESSLERSNLVIITGGLGPTNDDITKKTLSDHFGMSLVQDDKLFVKIQARLKSYGIPMNKFNVEQALVPDKCRLFDNNYGSAPCMWFSKDDKIIVSLPGVPSEMKGIMRDELIPEFKKVFSCTEIVHKTIMVQGIGESVLAEILEDFESSLEHNIKLAYLPSPGILRLRLSAKGDCKADLLAQMATKISSLKLIIPNNILAYDDEAIEITLAKLLVEKNLSVGTAESCTGGNIASLLSCHAGSSKFFKGSIVSYCNQVKNSILKVEMADLETYGAVSKPVVEQMAKGAIDMLNVDYAIATSGVAGPDGGTKDKPVGTVWIAVASRNSVYSKQYSFSNERDRNIRMASVKAINMLIEFISQ